METKGGIYEVCLAITVSSAGHLRHPVVAVICRGDRQSVCYRTFEVYSALEAQILALLWLYRKLAGRSDGIEVLLAGTYGCSNNGQSLVKWLNGEQKAVPFTVFQTEARETVMELVRRGELWVDWFPKKEAVKIPAMQLAMVGVERYQETLRRAEAKRMSGA